MRNLDKLTDDQLVAAYTDGNNEAFDVLLCRHQERVHNYIYRLVKDPDITEDLFQETFVKAIMTIKQSKYAESGKFAAWITRIAHNLIIDHFRQERSVPTVSTDEQDFDVLNRKDLSEETVEELIIDMQIRDDVRSLIKSLPAEQRSVLVMRYYKSLSFKEIADKTGVSINTALGRMRYAILNMRRIARENNMVLTR